LEFGHSFRLCPVDSNHIRSQGIQKVLKAKLFSVT
jgi:hypothetical protein